ncbi:hypothetical protein Baya_4503 [Bagarius yarrelli]|uniref:Uncharacterized protein n=1 Tax=Bagarius yarrelli TaxID=175774 RepID=A0A556TQD5_BAGYA|nr:hypothetical protein Baya_4503 [Bagarius yarrelli]
MVTEELRAYVPHPFQQKCRVSFLLTAPRTRLPSQRAAGHPCQAAQIRVKSMRLQSKRKQRKENWKASTSRVFQCGSREVRALCLRSARLMQALCCTAAHLLTSSRDQRRHEIYNGTHRACLTAAKNRTSIHLHKSAQNTALLCGVACHQTSRKFTHQMCPPCIQRVVKLKKSIC